MSWISEDLNRWPEKQKTIAINRKKELKDVTSGKIIESGMRSCYRTMELKRGGGRGGKPTGQFLETTF